MLLIVNNVAYALEPPFPDYGPILDSAIACDSCLDTGASHTGAGRTGRDNWRSVLQCFENVDDAFASTELRFVTSAGSVAVSLVLGPLTAYVAAAPTLIPFLHSRESISAAVAAVLAIWNA